MRNSPAAGNWWSHGAWEERAPRCGGCGMPGDRHSAWAGKLFVSTRLFKHPREGVKRVVGADSEHVAALAGHVPQGFLQLR